MGGVLREGDQRCAVARCLGGEPVDRGQVGPDVDARLQLPQSNLHGCSFPRPGGHIANGQGQAAASTVAFSVAVISGGDALHPRVIRARTPSVMALLSSWESR
jgi:hypothetical protein